MRVKPAKSKFRINPRWIGGGLLCCCLLALPFFIGLPKLEFPTNSSLSLEPQVQVLVARKTIPAGAPLEESTLIFEGRLLSQIPDDAIHSLDVLKGKVALATISNGATISAAQLGEPIAILPSQFEPKDTPPEVSLEALMVSPMDADTKIRAGTTNKTK